MARRIVSNKVLNAAITRVMSKEYPTQFTIDLQLYSEIDTSLKITPTRIINFYIEQNFAESYTDYVEIDAQVSGREKVLLEAASSGLMAALTLTYVSPKTYDKVPDRKPYVRKYHAIIVNKKSSMRQAVDMTTEITPDAVVKLQLVEDEIYKAHLREFHGVFREVTVESVMRYVLKAFEFNTVSMVKPDNTYTFKNLTIPPAKRISSVFDYLQAMYGVYLKGMEFYYTQGTFYVYPPYESQPKLPKPAIIYTAQEGDYVGALSFHADSDAMVEIVSAGKIDTLDLKATRENKGNAQMIMRSSQAVDGFMSTDNDKGTTVNKDNALTLRDPDAGMTGKGAQNAHYNTSTDNVYVVSSEMLKYDATLVTLEWGQAQPFVLQPGNAVQFKYDNNGIMASDDGILEAITYTTQLIQQYTTNRYVYCCHGNMRIRLKTQKASNTTTANSIPSS